MQATAVEATEDAAEEAEGEDIVHATPAELPDHAYIRTQATGAAWHPLVWMRRQAASAAVMPQEEVLAGKGISEQACTRCEQNTDRSCTGPMHAWAGCSQPSLHPYSGQPTPS